MQVSSTLHEEIRAEERILEVQGGVERSCRICRLSKTSFPKTAH